MTTLRALQSAYAEFGQSLRDVFAAQAAEIDRLRTELAEWMALVRQRDLEIVALKQQLNQLMAQDNNGHQ